MIEGKVFGNIMNKIIQDKRITANACLKQMMIYESSERRISCATCTCRYYCRRCLIGIIK